MHQMRTKSPAQWGYCAMSNTRNYEKTTALIINKRLEHKGYFSLAEVRSMYHARFLAGLYQACKTMVTNGKLVYDAQSKQYKNPNDCNR